MFSFYYCIIFLYASIVVSEPLDLDVAQVEAGFQQLTAYRNSCTFVALRDFVASCKDSGGDYMDASLRLELAVKLSICEFTEAGVDYPKECSQTVSSLNSSNINFLDCVASLRQVPQFWTTYSGNYRKLRSVCYEELAPYMKESIIELYWNITRLYSQFFESASSSASKMDDVQEQSLQNLRSLSDHIQKIDSQLADFETDLELRNVNTIASAEAAREAVVLQFHFLSSVLTAALQKNILSSETLQTKLNSLEINVNEISELLLDLRELSNEIQVFLGETQRGISTTLVDTNNGLRSFLNQLATFDCSIIISQIDGIEMKMREANLAVEIGWNELKSDSRDTILFIELQLSKHAELTTDTLDLMVSRVASRASIAGDALAFQLTNLTEMAKEAVENFHSFMSVSGSLSMNPFANFIEIFRFLKSVVKTVVMVILTFIFLVSLNKIKSSLGFQLIWNLHSGFVSFVAAILSGSVVALAVRLWFLI